MTPERKAEPKITRVLVPVDFSDPSRVALDYAAFVAARFAAALDLLHVWTPPVQAGPWLPPALASDGQAEAERELERWAAPLRGRDLRVGARVVVGGAAPAITRAAADGGYDLIVMGSHGRTGLSRALMGSVAEAVVRRAPCPVLTVRHR